MRSLLPLLLAAALLAGACSSASDAPQALDRKVPTLDRVETLLALDGGWTLETVDPVVGLIFAHEVGALPEGTLSYAQSSTFDGPSADRYLDTAIERLGQGRARFELLGREDEPYELAGLRSMRFRAGAFVDAVPLEVSVLIIVGVEATLIAQVVHAPDLYEVEGPRVDSLFEAIVSALDEAPATAA